MELIDKGTQFAMYFIKPIKEFMERRNQVNYPRKEKGKQSPQVGTCQNPTSENLPKTLL